jgi:zinc transporter ZupT
MKSNLFNLNINDLLKGLITAVLTAIVTALYAIIQTGVLPTFEQIKTILMTALLAGIAYLLKNFITNSDEKILKPEDKLS